MHQSPSYCSGSTRRVNGRLRSVTPARARCMHRRTLLTDATRRGVRGEMPRYARDRPEIDPR